MKSALFRAIALLVVLAMVAAPASAVDTPQTIGPGFEPEPLELAPFDSVQTKNDFVIEDPVEVISQSDTGLYIVRLKDASLAAYKGGLAGLQATSPEVTGARKLDVNTDTSQAYLDYLRYKQTDLINRIEAKLGRQVDVEYQYLAVLNGMAVAMSQEEAEKVAALDGVLSVRPDMLREMDTDAGPEHIGAATIWSGETISGLNTEGEGIVIGMIDSGINHAHPSFAATGGDGYTHTNPYGSGVYHGWCEANPTFCNDKLIGAYNLYTVGESPEDEDGHGSHTASTAGGNRHTATYNDLSVEIQGVAPHANIVAYKVCDPGCPSTASVAAVELAIAEDQVDVLNYSISGSDDPWYDDVDLAFLDAAAAGIFVSASAGNSGPGAGTVAKTGAWNAAVGASTHNRIIANLLNVTGPTAPTDLQGLGAVPAEFTSITIDLSGTLKYDETNNTGCTAFTEGYFTGSFALIQRGGCTFAEKEANAHAAGAVGMVLFQSVGGPPFIMGDTGTYIPSFVIDLAKGLLLKDYVLSYPTTTTIQISASSDFVYEDGYADVMGDFSSRGPSQFEILKPDYVAPGLNILAAVAANGTEVNTYDLLQGTSMSSPHGAGSAALMIALNPDLSPAEIKSMLAASANPEVLLNDDGVNEALPFDEGSGLIDLSLAPNIGLVFDETYEDYLAANPDTGGDPKTLNQPSMVNYECKNTCSWTRTVTSIADVNTTYTAAYDVPAGMTLEVSPATFMIAPGADQVLTITADVTGLPFDEVVFASVWLETDDSLDLVNYSDLKLPVVVVPRAEMPILTLDPTEISTLQIPDTTMTETLTIGNVGGADLEWSIEEAPASTYHLDFGEGYPAVSRSTEFATDASPMIESAGSYASVETNSPNSTINANLVMSVDDGTMEKNIGIGGELEFIYLNRFSPVPSTFPLTLNEIHVYFDSGGDTWVGDAISLVVYENTSGNADPAEGSILLYQQAATVTALDTWNVYTLDTPVVLNGPGDVLIGVLYLEKPGVSVWPAAIDQSATQQRSWIGWWAVTPPPTPPVLPPTEVWGLIDSLSASLAGNWMIRGLASYVGPCDNPEDVLWLSLDATSGTVIPGGLEEITVTTDSTGMTTGMYNANLCFYSNDPEAPLTVVPVAMEVAYPCITVDPISLEQTLFVDETATQTLSLTNSCDAPADFEIKEADVLANITIDLLSEGFEGGVMPPAGGWTTFHEGTTLKEWEIVDNPDWVHEGTYAAWANYDSANNSDEWLVSPVIDVSDYKNLSLSYWVYANENWPTATLQVWAADVNGDPITADPLWDMVIDENWPYPSIYRNVELDLSDFDGYGDLRLVWRYVGQDGDSLALDLITLSGDVELTWLDEDPVFGSVPANSSLDIDVTFDSTGLAFGDYDGLLKVQSLPYPDNLVSTVLHVVPLAPDDFTIYLPLIMK